MQDSHIKNRFRNNHLHTPLPAFRPPRYEPSSVAFRNISVYHAWIRSRPTLAPTARRPARPVRPAGSGWSRSCYGTVLPAVLRSYAVQTYSANKPGRFFKWAIDLGSCWFPGHRLAARPVARGPAQHRQPCAACERQRRHDAVAAGTAVQRRPVAAAGGARHVRGQARWQEPPLRARSVRQAAAGPRHGRSPPGQRRRALTAVNPPP